MKKLFIFLGLAVLLWLGYWCYTLHSEDEVIPDAPYEVIPDSE